ncbi:MAG: hypothetical protein B6D64_10200 [Bacteroidetes bacterium 4484_276]|nr:MAG: hypothetical protein B6D64_10200 [Bacteroidetes bacterium 4484_276]
MILNLLFRAFRKKPIPLSDGKFSVYLLQYKQGKMIKQRKKCAPVPDYVSPHQLTLEGLDIPLEHAYIHLYVNTVNVKILKIRA